MSLNKVILHGNLTRDPQLRTLPSNAQVCEFGVACNRKWKDRDGNAKEEVYFGDCQAWGGMADTINKHFRKGKAIIVEGRLKNDSWTDKDGNKRTATRIVVDGFDFVGQRESGSPPAERQSQQRRDDRPRGDYSPADDQVPNDSDLPF
jgi:single-strand DNA-binding protein